MSKRTLLLVVALIVSVAVVSTGTLAFLTATDSDVNVMTLGNVDIEQIELQRTDAFINRRSGGHAGLLAEGDLEPFQEGKPLYPAFPANNAATDYAVESTDLLYWGPYVTAEGEGNGLWNGNKLTGAADKMVFVENTGSSPAYYRTVFAFECPEGVEYSPDADKQMMMNINLHPLFTWEEHGYITVDGQRYLLMSAVYANELTPGEISRPTLLQVVMTHHATGEDVAKMGETYEILVVSQAVATENMPEDAAEALNAAFGELSVNSHPWMAEGEEGAQPPFESEPAMPILVSTEEELSAALKTPGATVALTKDITIYKGIAPADGVTLSLNGYAITDASTGGRSIGIQKGATVVVNGGGEIRKDESVDSTYAMPFYVSNGNLTVNGGTYNMGTPSNADYNCLLQNTAVMVINGGTFTNTVNLPLFSVIYSSTLEINGGHFESIGVTNPDLLDLEYHNTRISRILIKGGTFVNYNPLEDNEGARLEINSNGVYEARVIVADGYTVTSETQANGDVWYSVVPE